MPGFRPVTLQNMARRALDDLRRGMADSAAAGTLLRAIERGELVRRKRRGRNPTGSGMRLFLLEHALRENDESNPAGRIAAALARAGRTPATEQGVRDRISRFRG